MMTWVVMLISKALSTDRPTEESENMKLDDLRREYTKGKLHREDLADSPFDQFHDWMKVAIDANIFDPTAMSVATVNKAGRPSQRIVLLKDIDTDGFVFFTNLGSRKAKDIENNHAVSLLFSWLPLDRQIRIEGTAEPLETSRVLKYFLSRPRDSQLAAWASEQSKPVSARAFLQSELMRMKAKFSKQEVPLPSFWGGYKVRPEQFEFWQGGENRLHDRFEYKKQDDGAWTIERLAP